MHRSATGVLKGRKMMLCNCGYEFDESAVGIYGCPNCEGQTMSEKLCGTCWLEFDNPRCRCSTGQDFFCIIYRNGNRVMVLSP